MKYRNIKTGAIINIASEFQGENWEEVRTSKNPKKKAGEVKEEEKEG